MFAFSQRDKNREPSTPGALRAGMLPTGLKAVERVVSRTLTPANVAVKIQAVNSSEALQVLDPVISVLGIDEKEIISIYKIVLCTLISSARLFIILKKKLEIS